MNKESAVPHHVLHGAIKIRPTPCGPHSTSCACLSSARGPAPRVRAPQVRYGGSHLRCAFPPQLQAFRIRTRTPPLPLDANGTQILAVEWDARLCPRVPAGGSDGREGRSGQKGRSRWRRAEADGVWSAGGHRWEPWKKRKASH